MTSQEIKDAINAYVAKNPKAFKAGKTYTYKQFRRAFSWLNPKIAKANPSLSRESLQYVATYCKLNSYLQTLGIQIVARDYYTSFEILNQADAKDKVREYKGLAKRNKACATRLRDGIKAHKGLWSDL